jgi:hypothetical protein
MAAPVSINETVLGIRVMKIILIPSSWPNISYTPVNSDITPNIMTKMTANIKDFVHILLWL